MTGIVRIRHGALQRGSTRVLEPVSITLTQGAVIGVVGMNGAGKTTLMLSLAGVLRGQAAAVSVIDAGGEERRLTAVGFAPQEASLPGWMRVRDLVGIWGLDVATIERTLPGLRIGELANKPARTLSGGQRQAVSVAVAVASRAELIVLDEPFAALDLRRRRGLIDALKSISAAPDAPTILLSSQVGADLHELCTEMIVLSDGEYRFIGTRTQLVRAAGTPNEAPSVAEFEHALLHIMDTPATQTQQPQATPAENAGRSFEGTAE